jgi:hypothetical protein
VPWLLLRLLLDEQMVMEFMKSKAEGGSSSSKAAAAAGIQGWLTVSC